MPLLCHNRGNTIARDGSKTGGRDFKKGHAKMGGSKPMSEEQKKWLRILRSMNGKLIITKHCIKTLPELEDFIADEESPALELMIASTLRNGIIKADINTLNWFYARLGWDFDEENYRKKALIDAEIAKGADDDVDSLRFE